MKGQKKLSVWFNVSVNKYVDVHHRALNIVKIKINSHKYPGIKDSYYRGIYGGREDNILYAGQGI